MASLQVNVDLTHERANGTIDAEKFAEWWWGGRDALLMRRALEKLFFDDAEFDDPVHLSYLSHKELYEYSLAKATKFLTSLRSWQAEHERNEKKKGITKTPIQSMYDFRMLLTGTLGTALFQQSFPLRLHFSMFLPALLGQSTEEQKQEWLDKAWNMQGIVGTYGQTELGHGTFIRGLETRADYDIEQEEFILNTPTITAYKWWPGGLGQTANMVVVMAQLYVKGKHYGLHPFLVRIRDEETHMPILGVDVGEIGSKLGLNCVNNGFLGLKNVRIPRKQMLMKNAQVLVDGTFVKGPEPLLTYGTMVLVRVMIVRDVSMGLLQAATIATRYSAVRRQSPIEPDQPEPQIIEHITQQVKLFPQIAKGVVFRIVADYVWDMYQIVMKELDAGNRRNLPELHAISCCMKAVCSHEAAQGVEILRKACGGQGYMASSNFTQIYGLASAACTYEGENTVLLLQTSRFLLKSFLENVKRKWLPKSVVYIRDQSRPKWSTDLRTLVRILEITATAKVRIAFDYQASKRRNGNSTGMASNLSGIKLTEAATIHGRAFLCRIAYEKIELDLLKKVDSIVGKILKQLLELFILDMFLLSLGDILRFHPLSSKQLDEVEMYYERTLAAIRPNAIGLVDGFDFHDRFLNSTLGCYDGRVYERLMEEARKSPLNQESVNATFQTYLKPLMQGKL